MTASPALHIDGVTYTYERWGHRVRALRDVTLTIQKGEWLTIVGPNGSGKSTLLALLAGKLPMQKGRVLFAGRDVATLRPRERAETVFLVEQDPTLGTAGTLTVGEHLMLADGLHPKSGEARRRRSEALLASVRLEVGLQQPANTLSGGQRQLLVLLVANLRPASVVLLDEPFAALDPERTRTCSAALEKLHKNGKTLILVTHDIDFAIANSERTVALVEGELALDVREGLRTRERLAVVYGVRAA